MISSSGPECPAPWEERCEAWTARYSEGADNQAFAIGISPDSDRAFVTGASASAAGYDFVTVAYDMATGEELWVSRYHGPAPGNDGGTALTVGPDGSRVYVSGVSWGVGSERDYATIAYDAGTGEQLWVSRYDGEMSGYDFAWDVAVGPRGDAVYVTGESTSSTERDFVTVAYDSQTGEQLWDSPYSGPQCPSDGTAGGLGGGFALRVGPAPGQEGHERVYATGYTTGCHTTWDYTTIAYDGSSGDQLWVASYKGIDSVDIGMSLDVSPDGRSVYVTGRSVGIAGLGAAWEFPEVSYDYATIAYDAETGWTRWVARYNGPGDLVDVATSLDASPDGSRVYITGEAGLNSATADTEIVTIAYDSVTGQEVWVSQYPGGGGLYEAWTVAASRVDDRVYVGGSGPVVGKTHPEYLTLAFDGTTGNRLWTAYHETPGEVSQPWSMALAPDGRRLVLTGVSGTPPSGSYTTVAYDT
jgi:hypothetical protein